MNTIRITIAKSAVTNGFTVSSVGTSIHRDLPTQEAAEHYAAGVALGLRACGRSCEIVIDVPEDDADDLLDMAALDAWAQRAGGDAVEAAEVDPVERRLAREAEAGRFIASATGVG